MHRWEEGIKQQPKNFSLSYVYVNLYPTCDVNLFQVTLFIPSQVVQW